MEFDEALIAACLAGRSNILVRRRDLLCEDPPRATLEQLVFVTKMRWRIERDYQELKQEFGLSHYEGRG